MANILIVDDHRDTVELSAEVLESAGHVVRTGRNAEEGLRCLSTGPLPDCLLLDVDMPVVSGPEMARQMVINDGGAEKIPILLVSGREDLPEIATRVGTPYFLRKATPSYAKKLLALVARAIGERRDIAAV